jgi:hypothetical protein
MIKGSEARNWVGRSSAAPDCVHEQTALMTFENMRKYAWRNLCAKVESDAMGDKLFNDLPVVDGLFNLKQDNKNETKHTTNEQDGRHSRTSIEPNGQLEIDGDFY